MSGPTLSDTGLGLLHDAMVRHVERGALPGLITLVSRGGRTEVDVIGSPSFDDPRPLAREDVFRIASLTKPITAAAAMVLVDDGVIALDAPVARWLPELAHRRVLRTLESELDDSVPARRDITVEDLLTFRLGFGSIMAPPGTYPIQRAEADLALRTLGPPWPPSHHTPDSWMDAFGGLPLLAQPGEAWHYNTGAQVLGVLVERAAGRPFEAFLAERLFGPLGMVDTAFSVPTADRHRLTTAYATDPVTGALSVLDEGSDSWWSVPPAMPNGAGWLVSTVDDFAAFAAMLADGGKGGGGCILSEAAVHAMTSDHLRADQRAANRLFLGDGGGWGYGMRVPTGAGSRPVGSTAGGDSVPGAPGGGALSGGYGWDGGTGTSWRTDPDSGLTAILFTQRAMTSPQPPELFVDFWEGAVAALPV